jgi:TolA-binding protein
MMTESDTAKITSRLGAAGEALRGARDEQAEEPSAGATRRSRRVRDPGQREEDERYSEALELVKQGARSEALHLLERLVADYPNHVHARLSLFHLAVELRDQARAGEHHDFIVTHYLQVTNTEGLVQSYRETRLTFPELVWAEKSLIQVMHAGEKTHDARVAVDAAKLLLHTYPQSPTVPRALLLGARVQEQEGRPDLARATLQSIVGSYPMDPVAEVARRRLTQLA